MVTKSIWEDVYFTTDVDTFFFHIDCDGETIFNGKAVKFPDADTIEINVSRICQNYLSSHLATSGMTFSRGHTADTEAFRTFELYDDEGDTLAETYRFLNDWSYEVKDLETEDVNLSRPINGHYARSQYFMCTYLEVDTVTPEVRTTVSLNPSDITWDDAELYDVEACGDYVLYYRNVHSGYDCFLLEGNCKETDSLELYDTTKAYNNRTLDRGLTRYQTGIERGWQLNTGWLTDEQSETLARNLLGSTDVYLEDLVNGDVIPVVIMDSTAEHKKFKLGRKLNQYTINVKSSQPRIRK